MNYNKLNDIIQCLSDHDRFLLLIHDKPDGDALGSGTALALFLAALNKSCAVLVPCPIPARLAFIKNDKVTYFEGADALTASGFVFDFLISLDVASDELVCALPQRLQHGIDLAIDHHRVNTVTASEKYVDAAAAATGEVLFSLFSMYAMVTHRNVFDKALCEALFTSISSDTGCFKYGNTTSASHDIAAKLMEAGIDAEDINRRLFDTKSLSQIAAERLAYEKLLMFYDNRLAIVVIDRAELAAVGAAEEDTENISQLARMISGVQIGVLMREKVFSDGRTGYKFSVRSNVESDVSALCAVFGGGGHKKAAGCTVYEPKQNALDAFVAEAKNYLL